MQIIDEFCQAARNAIEAGLDGVEVHGANGVCLSGLVPLVLPVALHARPYIAATARKQRSLIELSWLTGFKALIRPDAGAFTWP